MKAVSFNRVAPFYDLLARLVFGKAITKAQTCFLDQIPTAASVLIIGGGTGWVLEEVLRRKQANRVDYVEASEAMLQLAQKKYQAMAGHHQATVHFISGTECSIPARAQYDVVLTFFVLDVQPDDDTLYKMMHTLHTHLKPSGLWLFADFKPQNCWWHKALVKLMFWFFWLTCHLAHKQVPDYERAFSKLQLRKTSTAYFYGQLIHSVVYRKERFMPGDVPG